MYLTKSNDNGDTFDDPIQVTKESDEGILEDFTEPQVAFSESSLFVAGNPIFGKHCILFTSSQDGGNSFEEVQNLNNLSEPDSCIKQPRESEKPPLKQI